MQTNKRSELGCIYGRVSTPNQRDNGTSLETQKAAGLLKAAETGIAVPEEYIILEDWSGTDLNRPGLLRLFNLAEAGLIRWAIIYGQDRLYRPENDGDEWQIFLVLQRLQLAGVEVIWIEPTVSPQSPMAGLFTYLKSWKSGDERRVMLERTRRGRLAIANKGGLLGGFKPYGYDYVPKTANSLATLEINEEQARVVRDIYRWLIEEHLSSRAIAKRLIDSVIPSPQGNKVWHPSVVHHMIRQELYCGVMYFNRREPVEPQRRKEGGSGKIAKSSRKLRPREDWIPIPVPAIIDRNTWEAAQVQIQSNAKFSGRHQLRQYLVSRLLTCGICGGAYTGSGYIKRGKEYRYYSCCVKDPLTSPDGRPCLGPRVNADTLEEVIWETVKSLLKDPDALREEFDRRQTHKQQPDERFDRRKELLGEMKRLSGRLDRFLDLYGDDKLDRDSLDRKVDETSKRRLAVEQELSRLDENEVSQRRSREASENLVHFCQTVSTGLDKLTFEERQKLLRLVVRRAIIKDKSHICIELALPLGPDDNISQLRPTCPPPSPPTPNLALFQFLFGEQDCHRAINFSNCCI